MDLVFEHRESIQLMFYHPFPTFIPTFPYCMAIWALHLQVHSLKTRKAGGAKLHPFENSQPSWVVHSWARKIGVPMDQGNLNMVTSIIHSIELFGLCNFDSDAICYVLFIPVKESP